MNMQCNTQYNMQIPNMMQNNPNFNNLVVNSSLNFGKDEIDTLKSFIFKAISCYYNYSDISRGIQDDCRKKFGGNWNVIVGEKEKFNISYMADKIISCSIGQYKIIIFLSFICKCLVR